MALTGGLALSKILIIDDEKAMVSLLKSRLELKGHEVLCAYNGRTGIELAKEQPDLIVLDIMMPEIDGFEVCREIRNDVVCPILFLSARQSETDKVKGFTMGGDDYITKPFGLKELLARIDANLRREKRSQYLNAEQKRSKLYFGEMCIDTQARSITIHGEAVELTRREYDISELLAFHAGQGFSKGRSYEKGWGYDAQGDVATVVERNKNIRSKFAAASPGKEYISTVWGIGYKWNKV